MRGNRLRYIDSYIKDYKKSIAGESPELRDKLTAVLDYAITISSTTEEFFELLSYGNLQVSSNLSTPIEVIKESMVFEKRKVNAYYRANVLTGKKHFVKDENPYAVIERQETDELLQQEVENLGEEEKKVVKAMLLNDNYLQTLCREMNKGLEYVMTLRKTALAHIYMKISEMNQDDPEKPAQQNGPVKGRSLRIPKDGALG